MKGLTWMILLPLAAVSVASAGEIRKFSLNPPPSLTRADLYAVTPIERPKAVLILCPGYNGNGEELIREPVWQEFAEKHQLGLVGLSFASEPDLIMERGSLGYYYAANGSGEVLLSGIREVYGSDLPLLFYGVSGGAHFTSRFVEWKPDRVISWCAYSAGWWDEPKRAKEQPPGIVACGDVDPRHGASMMYFKQGRAAGKPWLWVSLKDIGHSRSDKLEEFIRDYFSTILKLENASGIWIDVDLKNHAKEGVVRDHPSLTGWLPSESLLIRWTDLHQP